MNFDLVCPITQELFVDPVRAPAGEAKEASHNKWETGEVERESNNEGADGGHHRV